MSNYLVDAVSVTVTSPSSGNDYTFCVQLSPLELDRLRHEKILGFKFQRNKWAFLNSIAERLQEEILRKLMEMTK